MITSLLQFIRNIFKSKIQLQVENIYLRKQLEILSRTDLPPLYVPVLKLYSYPKHWLLQGKVLPPVPEAQNLMNYVA